jgi:hypothetical protein
VRISRVTAVLPLIGAVAAAAALAGAAVLTVNQAACGDSGHYVPAGANTTRLVGGCVNRTELPPVQAPLAPRQGGAVAHGSGFAQSQP